MTLSRIVRIPRALLRTLGFDVVRYSRTSSAADARRIQALNDTQVNVVLDVGASVGNYATKLRQSGYRGRILSFEPLSESYEKLAASSRHDSAWQTFNAAIGERDGSASINVSARSTSSSLLDMGPLHVAAAPDSAYVRHEQIVVRRLDTILDGIVRPDDRLYLKMDVQGYEASVLAGARETLATTQVIEVEVSTVPLYDGSVLCAQMIQAIGELGFRLVSWEDVLTDPKTGYVLQADCIFVRGT